MKNIWKTVSVLLCTVLLISAPAQVYATEKTAADYKEEIRERKEKAEERKELLRMGVLQYVKGVGIVDTRTNQIYKI